MLSAFLERKLYLVIVGHFSDVEQGVAHTTQCRVDAYLRSVGNFFETHVFVIAHNEYFALIVGQRGDEAAYVGMYLACDERIFDSSLAQLFAIENVFFFAVVVRYEVLVPFLPVVIDDEVMRNAGYPRRKFARFDITALFYGRDDFYKRLLEYVFGEIVILNGIKNIGIDTVFVPCKQNIECLVVPL